MTDNEMLFWELVIRCCKYKLNAREIKYILWHYACKKTLREIALLDGKGLTHQAISLVMVNARKKIYQNNN